MNEYLTDYYRCPERYVRLAGKGGTYKEDGYFRFGESVCYGRYDGSCESNSPTDALPDALPKISTADGTAYLPFDLGEVIDNLRYESYSKEYRNGAGVNSKALASAYYALRPLLPVAIRKHLQRWRLRGWDRLTFPNWPVDRTVDNLIEKALLLSLQAAGEDSVPFIWFWPNQMSSCAIMTHDVETEKGRDLCTSLMDMNDNFGVKASFQIIPEHRYEVTPGFLESIRRRGFEVVVHDLNHDGLLFKDREQFLQRAAKINSYGEQFGARGFRAGILYRKQLWFDALDFSYDMSVPNVAHLDPQRGGCCTVMPYFVGKILELPVTTTQDYTLFNILHDYSINLWKHQMDLIMQSHGLISCIVHPDYVAEPRERAVFEALLGHLAHLRDDKGVWVATPGEVNTWWRQRAEMKLVEHAGGWRIEGPGSERARIAYAMQKDGQIIYSEAAPTPA